MVFSLFEIKDVNCGLKILKSVHNSLEHTIFLGKHIIHMSECHSTNDKAAELYKTGQIHEGSIVITDHQTKGKGQRGNVWLSEPNQNLTFSILLKPQFLEIGDQFYLHMVTALSVQEAVQNLFDLQIQIKWPNDLYIENKKLGGILIENSLKGKQIDVSIVGTGINVNQLNFGALSATSLAAHFGQLISIELFLEQLVRHMERRYLQLKMGQRTLLKADYLKHMYWLGEWHVFEDQNVFEGKIEGIDSDGKLLILDRSGSIRSYAFKEVKFIR